MKRAVTWLALAVAAHAIATGQDRAPRDAAAAVMVLKPARVFDGDTLHEGWVVRVRGDRIDAAGPATGPAPAGAEVIDLPGTTLLPGLIEGHSHVLLHPYNETTWNDQVLHESLGLRTARARQSSARDAEGRLHDDPRPRHRRSGLRRRRAQAGGRPGHHSRSAHARRHARDRRDRQLRPEGLRARMARAAGRGGSRRRRARPRRPRSDRPRRGLDQGLRRLPVGPARRGRADVLARRS